MNLGAYRGNLSALLAIILLACLVGQSSASLGDHLPDFRECVKVNFPPYTRSLYTSNFLSRFVKPRTAILAIRCYVRLPCSKLQLSY